MEDIQKAECKNLSLAQIEEQMLKCDQAPIPLTHIFSGGVYIRQIEILAGTLVMGKRHRFECCNILLKGRMRVYMDDNTSMELEGPAIFTSAPMAKKFALCLEDAIFANIIPTNETDPDKVEEFWIIPEAEYLALEKGEQKCLS